MTTKEKIAIVTGAGTGTGKAAAAALLVDGWHVVFAGRRLDRLQEAIAEATDTLQSEIRETASAPRAMAGQTDVTEPDSVRELFERTRATFGRLDLLFNNAGIGAVAMRSISAQVARPNSIAYTATKHVGRG